MKTLYISDLDGTLLNNQVEVSEYTKQTINKCVDAGAVFTVATARTIATVSQMLEGIHINAPVVLMNGALIYDMEKKNYVHICPIEKMGLEQLLCSMKAHNMTGFVYTVSDHQMHTYHEELKNPWQKAFREERIKKYQKEFTQVEDLHTILDQTVVYVSLFAKKEELDPVYEEIKDRKDLGCAYYQDIYSEDLWYLEICSSEASKYHALMFLREYLKPEYVVAFGDNTNDLPLFEACDYKVAVANAKEPVRKAANELTEKNTDDGVARFLVEHFL